MVAGKFKIELVRWLDASSLDGPWADMEEIKELREHVQEPCTTLGFVIHDCPEVLVLAASLTDSQLGGTMAIPKVAVLRRIQLELDMGELQDICQDERLVSEPQIAPGENGVQRD